MNRKINIVSAVSLFVFTLLSLCGIKAEAQGVSNFTPAKKFNMPSLVGGMQGVSYLLNLKTGKIRDIRSVGERVFGAEASPNGKWLLKSAIRNPGAERIIYVQSSASGQRKRTVKLPDVSFYFWEADSSSFIVYYDGYLRKRFYISQPGQSQELSADEGVSSRGAWGRNDSPNRKYYVAPIANKNVFVVKRTQDSQEIRRFKGDFRNCFLRWSPNSKRMLYRQAIGNGVYQDSSWDISSNRVHTLSQSTDSVKNAYSPDEKWLLAAKTIHSSYDSLYLSRVGERGHDILVTQSDPGNDISVTWLEDGYHVLLNVGHVE